MGYLPEAWRNIWPVRESRPMCGIRDDGGFETVRVRLTSKTRIVALAAMLLLAGGAPSVGRADSAADCFGEDIERRIEGCTALIEGGDTRSSDLSLAYAMRALAYSLKG